MSEEGRPDRRKQLISAPAKMSPAPVLSTTFTLGTSTWEILFPSRMSAESPSAVRMERLGVSALRYIC